MASTLARTAVDTLRASAAVTALVPAGHIYASEEPKGVSLPYVVVNDREDEVRWITETARVEKHDLRVSAYAEAGGVADAPNAADAIAAACAAALDWTDPPLAGIMPVRYEEAKGQRGVTKTMGPGGHRVHKAVRRWWVEFGRNS